MLLPNRSEQLEQCAQLGIAANEGSGMTRPGLGAGVLRDLDGAPRGDRLGLPLQQLVPCRLEIDRLADDAASDVVDQDRAGLRRALQA